MDYLHALEMLPQFEQRVTTLASKYGDTGLHAAIYNATLRHLLKNPSPGACHLFAAILYVLFVEAEFVLASPDDTDEDTVEYRMCVGVARSPDGTCFDHSWVEAEQFVYDIAVFLPMDGGAPTDGPVYASHDLLTMRWVQNRYLQHRLDSLDPLAQEVATWTLNRYAEEIWRRDKRQLWETITHIGHEIGFSFEPGDLKNRHGSTFRVRVESQDDS